MNNNTTIYGNIYKSIYTSFFYNSFSKKKLMQYPVYFRLVNLLRYSKNEEDIDGESTMIHSIISDNIDIVHIFVDKEIEPSVYCTDYRGNSIIFFVSTEFNIKSKSDKEAISYIIDYSIFMIREIFNILKIKNINKVIDKISPLIVLFKIVQDSLYKDYFYNINKNEAYIIIKEKYLNNNTFIFKNFYSKYFENGTFEKIYNDIRDYNIVELLDECKILGCDFRDEDAISIIL